ncbi:hypothetical protein B0F90DRAFT_1621732 [Multifurca ochricompacta]|uniref:FAS1 domain-containing protein n=1 Tax=Multifurca ochricompacta TaxID=376703 RepID=A0AAD4QQ91_9AGAM|nr:hypothetical protein B0F90DRAFT_1621732 [Multifurca ochricompacta]
MQLLPLIPLSLLALLSCSVAALPSQSTFHPHADALSTTLVDKLSEDSDYTTLLRLLQRARLIPTLNRLNGSTFFAPTNDAIHRDASLSRLSSIIGDNVNEQLRQELFYHLLNYTVVLPKDHNILVTKTLHFPHDHSGPPSQDPPPSPPWLPIPGGALGNEPQRLRVAGRNGQVYVGVDAFGKGGAKVVKGPIDAGNGLLAGIDSILAVPPSLANLVSTHPSTSYFHRILTPAVISRLNETAELTLFVPVDTAWNALHPIEKLYLESEFAANDLTRIFEMHAVVKHGVKWSESFDPAINLTTLDGRQLNVVTASNKTLVSDAELVEPDIYASNGVLHTISSLLIPEGALQLTPEKFLLTLNCTNFISMIHSVNLTHLINDTDAEYTILAPQDDVISAYGDEQLPEKGTDDLKRLLKYHFLPGRWTPKALRDGLLIETKLDEPGLAGKPQVLEASISRHSKRQAQVVASISFGGASTIGNPIEINNTVIYFISRPLFPPGNSLQVALPTLNFSSFLAAIFSADLADTIKTSPRTTLLVPHNDAFKRLGLLVSAHLLSASATTDLESVVLHHVIDDVVYARDLQNSTARTYPTLEGSDLHVEHTGTGSITFTPSGGWAGLNSEVIPMNLLSETGAVHELSDIFIPRSVQLTVGKLAKAAKGTTMTNLIIKAGMEWILNGTAPPVESPWGQKGVSGTGWTLLCPSDDAFKKVNLTRLYSDRAVMQLIVGQHLLNTPTSVDVSGTPNNNRPLRFRDPDTYETLISPESNYRDVVFRESDNGEVVVGIKNARGTGGKTDWAKVTGWGRATTGGGTGGVIQIDRLLVPYEPPLWMEYGVPVVVAIFGVLAIGLFFMCVRKIWRLDRTEATYEPIGKAMAKVPSSTASAAAENVKSFIAGGFGGVCAVLVGHPFDLTKTRLQTALPGTYTGGLDVIKKTLARDGPSGLYRGVVPPLLGVTPIFALSFWAYDSSKRLILSITPNRTDSTLSTGELAAAGFLSAVPTTLVTAPVERAKVLLQVQGQGAPGTQYKGVFDVIGHLYKEGGIRSIFRGTFATLARDGPGSAAYFAAYEVTKKALAPANASSSDLNIGQVILAGGTAGVAMWSIAIPPDVLKSRLQSAPTGTYSGIIDCARKTIATDGVKALWKGFGPAMARAFPANAATFLGVEATRKIMDNSAATSTVPSKKKTKVYSRSLSASEIARNAKAFDTWCSHQGCEEVAFSDLPSDFKEYVDSVFNTRGRLPAEWVNEVRTSDDFVAFIAKAHKECPGLFSGASSAKNDCRLLDDMKIVFSAWERLQRMRPESKDKVSEADFVSNVYERLRSSALRESTYRAKWSISLPQPFLHPQLRTHSLRILNAKSVVPDCAVFVPERVIRRLSLAADSAFKQLRRSKFTGSATRGGESFACQSTPCVQLPHTPGFQFVSSFWEDKKPVHSMLEDAYRQNRMSTAAAVRHLHSLHVKAPVFGLVWSDGSVRAHVDWYDSKGQGPPIVRSALFPGPHHNDGGDECHVHEWNLYSPAGIIEMFLLIRNIDYWTTNGFVECIEAGIADLLDSVLLKGCSYQPWKRVGNFRSTHVKNAQAAENSSSQPSAHTPVAQNTRSRRCRGSQT